MNFKDKIEQIVDEAIQSDWIYDGTDEIEVVSIDKNVIIDSLVELVNSTKPTQSWKMVDEIAQKINNGIVAFQQAPPLVRESKVNYREDTKYDMHTCTFCRGLCLTLGMKYCVECGARIAWNRIEMDPREKIICDFCGKNNIDRRIMISRGEKRICSECIREIESRVTYGNGKNIDLDEPEHDDDD